MANNNGILYKNPKHTEGSNLPRYVGVATINGINKNVSAWVKKDKNGKNYISLAFTDEIKVIKEKIIPVRERNKSGRRDLNKIGVGNIDVKKQIIDITDEDLPF